MLTAAAVAAHFGWRVVRVLLTGSARMFTPRKCPARQHNKHEVRCITAASMPHAGRWHQLHGPRALI
jgi:hypothetical protein